MTIWIFKIWVPSCLYDRKIFKASRSEKGIVEAGIFKKLQKFIQIILLRDRNIIEIDNNDETRILKKNKFLFILIKIF